MPAPRLVLLAVLAVAACASQPAEPWEGPGHTPPKASEVAYCHDEGRRQASVRYPAQPPREERGLPRISDQREFPAEIRFYEQCMTRLGYVRAAAPKAG
jgi:hypothetical protein